MARSLMDLYGGGMGGPATNYQLGGAIAQSRRGREYQGEIRALKKASEEAARRQKKSGFWGGVGSFLGGAVGSLLGPAGTAAGAAFGRGLGESGYKEVDVSGGKYAQQTREDIAEGQEAYKEGGLERAITSGIMAGVMPGVYEKAGQAISGGAQFLKGVPTALEAGKELGGGMEYLRTLGDYAKSFGPDAPFGGAANLASSAAARAKAADIVGGWGGDVGQASTVADVGKLSMPVRPTLSYTPQKEQLSMFGDLAMEELQPTILGDFSGAGLPPQFTSNAYQDLGGYGPYLTSGVGGYRKGGGLINYEKPLMQAGGYLSSSLASPMIGGMEEYGMEPPSPQPPPPPPPPSPPAPPAGSGLGLPPTIGGTGMGTGTGAGTFTGTGTGAGTVTGTGTGTGAGIGTLTGTGAGTGGSAGPPPPVAPTVYGPVMPSTPATSGATGQIGGTYGTAIDPMAALQQMGMGDIASDPKLQEYLKDLPQFSMGYQQQLGDIKSAGRQSLGQAYAAQRMGGAGRGFAGAGIGGQQFGQQVGDIRAGVGRQRRGVVEGFQQDLLSSIRDIEQKGEFEFGAEATPWEQMGITESEYNYLMGIEQAQDVPETGDMGLLDPTQTGMGGTTGWGGTVTGTTGIGGVTGWGGQQQQQQQWGQPQWGQSQQQQNPWQQQTTGQQEQQYDEFGFPIG